MSSLNLSYSLESGKIFSFGAGGDGQLGHGDTEVGIFIDMLRDLFVCMNLVPIIEKPLAGSML